MTEQQTAAMRQEELKQSLNLERHIMANTQIEAMKLALEALDSTDTAFATKQYYVELEAMNALRQALEQQPADEAILPGGGYVHPVVVKQQPAALKPLTVDELKFLKQVVGAAIAGLYYHNPQDIAKTFDTSTLLDVADTTKPLINEKVEEIYKRAWEILAAAPEQKGGAA